MSYKMDFDANKGEKDKAFEVHGQRIVVDPGSYLYLIGMTLDFDVA